LAPVGAVFQGDSCGVVAEVSAVTPVELMTMFNVCQCVMPGWQRRFRGGRVSGHAGGTDDEVCHLSVRYARSTAAVSRQKSWWARRRDTLAGLMTMFGTC